MSNKLAFGSLFVATTASLTIAVTGLAGLSGGPGGPVGFLTPDAAAAELVPFGDCDELLQWYVDEALPEVGPYGLGGWSMVLPAASSEADVVAERSQTATSGVGADSADPVQSSDTGTNVQEVGVDEPDRAKTDGEHVVHVRRNTLVVTDVTGTDARQVGSLALPEDLAQGELLLAGDTVLVVGAAGNEYWGGPATPDLLSRPIMPGPAMDERSRLVEISIEDPAAPQVVSDQTFGGRLISARQHGDTVRLVLSTSQPVIDFVEPNRERTEEEATEENRQILRESDIEDWLPTVRVGDGPSAPLVDCSDVRHPGEGAGYGTVAVVTVDATDPTSLESLGVTTNGETVYSSTDRLYLATWGGRNATEVHAFAVDGSTTSYVASGKVPGVLRDRWSMDEHDGVLRLALAHGRGWWAPQENGVTTLREDGDSLVVAGSVRGLGPDEEIKSVRWFDDLAIVVTFRQTDPLYTVDLSDPADPRTLGELKIPGFSEYLHPIGDDRLLGLGQDATDQGEVLGGQASLFDVGDLAEPARLDTLSLGKHVYPQAAYDPRTFTWLPERESGLAVVQDQWHGGSSLVEVRVRDDGTLLAGDSWRVGGWDSGTARALPLPGGSSVAVVTDEVEVVALSPR